MLEIIGLIILTVSLTGMVFIIYRKIPVLAELSPEEIKKSKSFIVKIKEEIKTNIFSKAVASGHILLLKVLSKIRIFLLKIESKIAFWVSILRQKSKKKKTRYEKNFSDDYWERIKKKQKIKIKIKK